MPLPLLRTCHSHCSLRANPIARLMGKDIPNFSMSSSPLPDLLTIDGASRTTELFVSMRFIPEGASYMTFQQIGGLSSPYAVFELAGYNRAAARKLVDPIAAMSVAAARDAIGRLDAGLQSAARSIVGTSAGGKWSAYKVFELAGYDRAATQELIDPIAAMPVEEVRDNAIGRLAYELQSAARTLVGSKRGAQITNMKALPKDQNSNSKDVFINVEDRTLGTTTLFYYACSHVTAAYKLSNSLGVTCTASSLGAIASASSASRKGGVKSACEGLITISDETDREKATLLGDTQVLKHEYQNSATYKANAAEGAKRRVTYKTKHGHPYKGKTQGKTQGIAKLAPR